MPHATSQHDSQDYHDDLLIRQALDPENPIDFNRELEPGEKADDAIDFGDLSDNDLAEEETESKSVQEHSDQLDTLFTGFENVSSFAQDGGGPEETRSNSHEGDGFDDLFGDPPSSPVEDKRESIDPLLFKRTVEKDLSFDADEEDSHYSKRSCTFQEPSLTQTQEVARITSQPIFRPIIFNASDATSTREQQLQQELFAMSGSGCGLGGIEVLPPPPENREELLASLWPNFERSTVPRFMNLLPPKKTHYIGKRPLKRPKVVHPTKISLELNTDQAKGFKLTSSSSQRPQEELDQTNIFMCSKRPTAQWISDEDEDIDSDLEHQPTRGASWQDLQFACGDWDNVNWIRSLTYEHSSGTGNEKEKTRVLTEHQQSSSDPLKSSTTKKRKLHNNLGDILIVPRFLTASLSDPERATRKIAGRVTLDLNDTRLLVDSSVPDYTASSSLRKHNYKNGERGVLAKDLNNRYNVSNDDAYDLLKENHQSKIRSTLGTMTVEHSTPAIRLQWPYYKTKLEKQEARSFHRPMIKFQRNEQIGFSKPRIVKKKHLKGKDVQTVFESTKEVSLGDNSNALLLEYSEEYPTMMSNFGMGSRLINYYRRKNMEDISRPKLEIGETAVLLPQDKSPFSIFGHIDPGQITPALYNSMFKAPIFKQEARPTDFLVIRNTTGINGPTWYMRNIENLHVVGQEFPSIDVPGPHSRKVTTAAKNRLKMISYRQIRRKPIHRISVAEITKHFTDTTDMQNRQKMKEFMQFSKEHKEWEMRPGEAIPDEATIRVLVKPEDVCLLESMQVGQQHLRDAGFSKGDDDSEDDEAKEGRSIEQQLAPWFTSRNFLNAAQGKAMLQLHGEGDPSGRGEAFSFIKTSMKGGFKAMGESVEDKIDAKKLKELGGHSYNVAKQQRSYDESIRRIWDAQKLSLSSTFEQSDTDVDEDRDEEIGNIVGGARTPRSEAQTPAPPRRRDDETTSQFSKFSTDSQAGKILRITRDVRDKHGNLERIQEVIRNPRVIRQYLRRRHAKEAESTMLSELKPTGDVDQDRRNQQRLEKELARLERNKDRRLARDKQKSGYTNSTTHSPKSPASPAISTIQKTIGTQRKCANCGQTMPYIKRYDEARRRL